MTLLDNFQKYEIKKKALLGEFKKNLEQGPISLGKKTSNLFRKRASKNSKKLDVKHLNQVISVDPVNLVAEVEAMTTYEELVKETLKSGCLPAVVPQLKTITIGGALVGLGIEASSFRYGLVHETILEIEVLTGDGTVLSATADNQYKDLFFAFPNSYGTLGIALKIKLSLIPAKKFIKLTNLRFTNVDLYFKKINELCKKNRLSKTDSYIDGVIFDKNEMYIILGEFVDEAPFLSDYTYMNIYYQSIRKRETNYLTTYDYIWRWDADWFWCSKHMGMNNLLLRRLFGKFMLRSSVYWKISQLMSSNPILKFFAKLFEKPSESVIQDILIPIQKAPQFFDFFSHSIGITPIWICPFQSLHPESKYSLFPLNPNILYVDFGFWDIVPSEKPNGYLNQLIEKKTVELEGYKSLYSESYYSEDDFWQIHPKSTFEKLKKKYDPKGAFRSFYDKCVHRK